MAALLRGLRQAQSRSLLSTSLPRLLLSTESQGPAPQHPLDKELTEVIDSVVEKHGGDPNADEDPILDAKIYAEYRRHRRKQYEAERAKAFSNGRPSPQNFPKGFKHVSR